jgi:hypothetical protein
MYYYFRCNSKSVNSCAKVEFLVKFVNNLINIVLQIRRYICYMTYMYFCHEVQI